MKLFIFPSGPDKAGKRIATVGVMIDVFLFNEVNRCDEDNEFCFKTRRKRGGKWIYAYLAEQLNELSNEPDQHSMMDSEIIIYQTPDGNIKIDVRL